MHPARRRQAAASLPTGATQQERGDLAVEDLARTLARISIADIAVFFAVLLVGFAYVWKRGDLDWVRSVARQKAFDVEVPSSVGGVGVPQEQPALTL